LRIFAAYGLAFQELTGFQVAVVLISDGKQNYLTEIFSDF
jgi:hypothetical protein